MKTYIPKHIKWWMFNMHLTVWPLTITIIQLFIIAWWTAIALMAWNSLVKNGMDKVVAALLASPILIISIIIAFFRISELSLLPFIAKWIRTSILDEKIKYQINFNNIDPIEVKIKMIKSKESKKKIEIKWKLDRNENKLDSII